MAVLDLQAVLNRTLHHWEQPDQVKTLHLLFSVLARVPCPMGLNTFESFNQVKTSEHHVSPLLPDSANVSGRYQTVT